MELTIDDASIINLVIDRILSRESLEDCQTKMGGRASKTILKGVEYFSPIGVFLDEYAYNTDDRPNYIPKFYDQESLQKFVDTIGLMCTSSLIENLSRLEEVFDYLEPSEWAYQFKAIREMGDY